MASSREYLEYVLEQLNGVGGVSHRAMMGEYVLYCRGKVVGGIYDDRLLLKPTASALALLEARSVISETDIPYDGAKPMLIADVDNRELLASLVETIAQELPEPKSKKPKGA